MSHHRKRQQGDPAKRAERKARHRDAIAKGIEHVPRQRIANRAQVEHASNPTARRWRKTGEDWLNRQPEPTDLTDPDDLPTP